MSAHRDGVSGGRIPRSLRERAKALGNNRDLLRNAASLLGTTVVTSVLGFAYWGLAARLFSTSAVGYASAGISAMTLLGTFGMFGFGTVLIGELGRDRRHAGGTVTAALIATAVVSAVLGILGALLLPIVSTDLRPFASGVPRAALFAVAVSLTSFTFVLDQALIGLMRGGVQLWRNTIFSIVKLAVLPLASVWFSDRHGISIFVTWSIGSVTSLLFLVGPWMARRAWRAPRPRWEALHALRGTVMAHNWLNTAMQAPRLLLPIVVVAVMSPEANAAFYAAWLLVGFLYMIPTHLSTVLYAVGAQDVDRLRDRARFTLTTSFAVGLVGAAVLILAAPWVLRLFGASYADEATGALRVLALGVFPNAVIAHFVALCRVGGRIVRGGVMMSVGGAVQLAAAAVEGHAHGLVGLSLGLLVGTVVLALLVTGDVLRVLRHAPAAAAS